MLHVLIPFTFLSSDGPGASISLFSSLARSVNLCTLYTIAGKEWGLYTFEKKKLNNIMCRYTKATNCVHIRAHLGIEVGFSHYYLHTDMPRMSE